MDAVQVEDKQVGGTLRWQLERHFARLPNDFYTLMGAERVGEQPLLIHANPKAAALIDLDLSTFTHEDFAAIFSGHTAIDGFDPLAMVYAGHQFGVWVPQLGDGRALLIAQVRNRAGELWDVQLKGAGRTPYSRMGDGRAVLRSTIREYLGSEAVAALGIPTTRGLSIVATREAVRRETIEPGAVLTRLSPSHVRFGHFEFFAHSGRPELVRTLADYVIGEHFSHLPDGDQRHNAWFREVVERTADLIALWQSVGFAHGVMNTDNMSILGLTLDYGPFGFLDRYAPSLICNHSDDAGRYAFNRQPAIARWNLHALASALTTLIPVDDLRQSLDGFGQRFSERYLTLMRAKLGLLDEAPNDTELAGELLGLMEAGQADYAQTFRKLGQSLGDPHTDWPGLFSEPVREQAATWLSRYRDRVKETGPESHALMTRTNPKFVLRNWVAETAIRAVEDRGDTEMLDRILNLVQSPFDEHESDARFAEPPPPELCDLSVSCSS